MQRKRIHKYLLSGISVLFLLSCNSSTLPAPRIVNDTATLSGTLTCDLIENEEPVGLLIRMANMISGTYNEIEIPVDENGLFSIDIPVETNPSVGVLILDTEQNYSTIMVQLKTDEPTIIHIACKDDGKLEVEMENDAMFNSYDMIEVGRLYMETTQPPILEEDLILYELTPEQLVGYINHISDYQTDKVILSNTNLSGYAKEFFARDIRLMYYSSFSAFDYQGFVVESYQRNNPHELWDSFVPPTVELSYYSFLKDLDLNNPRNLYALNGWLPLLDRILSNEDLAIQKIGDTAIDAWIKESAKTLGDLVGFDKGLFYDMLAVRSYIMQFENQAKPLSKQQKQNITKYFKNKAVAQILFRENEIIEKLASHNSTFTINATPDVPDEELLDSIVAKYEGRAIVIDFWATWCGPCAQAIRELRETKNLYEQQGVVFVYVSNISSSEKRWRERIEGIGGEHYYLTKEQWNTIMESIETTGIPTYLLYDTNGNLVETIVGYDGVADMQERFGQLIE